MTKIPNAAAVIGTEVQPACYLCGGHGEILYRDIEDRLFGEPGRWTFKQCPNPDCGLIWLDPMPTRDEIGKAYQNYYTHGQPKGSPSALPGIIIRLIFRLLLSGLLQIHSERKRRRYMYLDQMPPGRLLEVGCGSGRRLARMRALGWKVMGQEIDPAAAEQAHKRWDIDVHLGPLETMDTSAEAFDAVIVSHVIEHVHDPIGLLSTCHRLLKHGGQLVASTPNAASYGHHQFGASWRGLEPPRHLHLFTCGTLMQMSQRVGFSHQRCWTTAVTADNIGRGSRPSTRATIGDHHIFTAGEELCGMLFQIAANRNFMRAKDSGEECVLMATK